MKVHILAASDRNNYGDLLFPIVIKKYLENREENFQFYNYGIIKSDLRSFGALPTYSFTEIQNNNKHSDNYKIVIAGGEVLGGGWLNIQRFVSGFWNKIHHFKYFRYPINKFELLEKYFYFSESSSRPFILDGNRFDKNKIYYNSIGAQGAMKLIGNNKKYQKYFNEVKHLSIRDKGSRSIFDKFNITNHLVPDSVLILSDLITDEFEKFISEECLELSSTNYIFFQLGDKKGPEKLDDFILKLKNFSEKQNLKVLLCPIGLALDHGDDIILKQIKNKFPELEYYHPENLYETMFLIKESEIYIGTSLHGVLTAQTFNRPFFVFPEKIGKLRKYIETWFDNAEELFGNFSDFGKLEKRYLNFESQFENEKRNTDQQKDLIYHNLLSIFPTNE
ncbi:polysaccharide pyruvyl transferase family protein [Kaistella sp.]|uniref:polysaccharide pyruvyl transferase family protein n=1 Tax=Kaistella sp. TaxID=2782235 RepID=UPI0035A04130